MEKSITAKEFETILMTAYNIEKRNRENKEKAGRRFWPDSHKFEKINHGEILDIALGMIQEKLQVEFCPGCGGVIPCKCMI